MLKIRVVSIRGMTVNREYDFPSEGALVFGRDSSCDVCLSDPFVSRRHARIIKDGNAYIVEDLGSVTGTFVDGARINDLCVASIRDGTRIVIGATEMIVSLTDAAVVETGLGNFAMWGQSHSDDLGDVLKSPTGGLLDSKRLRFPDRDETAKTVSPAPDTLLPPELLEPRRAEPKPNPPAERSSGLWQKLIGALRNMRRPAPPAESIPIDEVECSVFAPPRASPGSVLFVQMFAHTPAQTEAAEQLARQFDEQSRRRGFSTLDLPVPRGAELTFHLVLPGLEILKAVEQLVWRGRPGSVQFSVAVPDNFVPGVVIGTALISRDNITVGHIKFKLEVTAGEQLQADNVAPSGVESRRYRKAFISYASADRDEVLKRVQMLRQVGIDFFQDLLDLEPGVRWEQQLYRHIDDSDLFLLFWSSSARQSNWVMEELRYALQRKGTNELAAPEIQPVVIEGPPPTPPPNELAHLHFNDYFLYFIGRGK
jgi:hypothetical protein